MPPSKKFLILFAKVPKPGEVKTRLTPPVPPAQAARLYQAFMIDLLEATESLRGVTRIMSCTPTYRDPFFQSLADRYRLRLTDQRGANLGERMMNAISDAGHEGAESVVILGTDIPTLPMELVRKAFSELRDVGLVLGPSLDGGYYLIGCQKAVPPLFEGIPWGTDRVLAMTVKKTVELQLKTVLLPFWYDVDTAQDLRWLASHLEFLERQGGETFPRETARLLKALNLE